MPVDQTCPNLAIEAIGRAHRTSTSGAGKMAPGRLRMFQRLWVGREHPDRPFVCSKPSARAVVGGGAPANRRFGTRNKAGYDLHDAFGDDRMERLQVLPDNSGDARTSGLTVKIQF